MAESVVTGRVRETQKEPSKTQILSGINRPTAKFNLHVRRKFEGSVLANIHSPVLIQDDIQDRRIANYWFAFLLQIVHYPIHAAVFSAPGTLYTNNLTFRIATLFLASSAFCVVLSLLFKLKARQAAAELSLFLAGTIVVIHAGLVYLLCLAILEGIQMPGGGNIIQGDTGVLQNLNLLIPVSLSVSAGTSLIAMRITYLGFVYGGNYSMFGIPNNCVAPEMVPAGLVDSTVEWVTGNES